MSEKVLHCLGKVTQDLTYCEVFVDHSPDDPMDTALHTGDTVEVCNECEGTYLILVEWADGSVEYGTVPVDTIELQEGV